jgi:hypothetical protein
MGIASEILTWLRALDSTFASCRLFHSPSQRLGSSASGFGATGPLPKGGAKPASSKVARAWIDRHALHGVSGKMLGSCRIARNLPAGQ